MQVLGKNLANGFKKPKVKLNFNNNNNNKLS